MSTPTSRDDTNRDAIDRRQDLSVKVAILEERSINNRDNFETFHNNFMLHAKSEELLLNELVDKIDGVNEVIDDKLNSKVNPVIAKVDEHEKALTRFTTIIGTLALVISTLWAILEYLKEPLLKWLMK